MNAIDIKTFSDQLLQSLKANLAAIAEGPGEGVAIASRSTVAARAVLLQLKDFVHRYKFKNAQEEIEFFKTIKPVVTSQYLYHDKLFKLQINEPIGDSEALRVYYISALNGLREFLATNHEFYHYCLSNSTHLDETYFKRNPGTIKSVDMDNLFTTGYDDILAAILANQLFKEHLLKQISIDSADSSTSPLTWTGTKAALIELIYALQSVEAINKGKTDIREIATSFERLFQIDLGNYYRQFQDIRLRKKGKTNFLDELKNSLEQRMEEFE